MLLKYDNDRKEWLELETGLAIDYKTRVNTNRVHNVTITTDGPKLVNFVSILDTVKMLTQAELISELVITDINNVITEHESVSFEDTVVDMGILSISNGYKFPDGNDRYVKMVLSICNDVVNTAIKLGVFKSVYIEIHKEKLRFLLDEHEKVVTLDSNTTIGMDDVKMTNLVNYIIRSVADLGLRNRFKLSVKGYPYDV